jgi:hypothetical protein
MTEPVPGSYACVDIPTIGRSIRLFGKTLHVTLPNFIGLAIKLFTSSKYCHAFILVAPGRIIEARPGGAALADLSEYDGMPILWSHDALTPEQREKIVDAAYKTLGTPYGYLDILALGLLRLGLPYHWVFRRVLSERTDICSQLVAICGEAGGDNAWLCGKLFPELVTPGDLARRIS